MVASLCDPDPQMKAPRACWHCRQSKRKCSRRGPCEPCDPCQRKHLQCGFELGGELHRPVQNSLSLNPEHVRRRGPVGSNEGRTHSHTSTHGVDLPPRLATHRVDLYLGEFHDRTQSIFHAATLRAKVTHGNVSSALLYAICAMGCKFWTDPERRVLEPRLTEAAKCLLKADLENICVENIQTCIILANLNAGNGIPHSQALYLRK
jgi:hypothetical protein